MLPQSTEINADSKMAPSFLLLGCFRHFLLPRTHLGIDLEYREKDFIDW